MVAGSEPVVGPEAEAAVQLKRKTNKKFGNFVLNVYSSFALQLVTATATQLFHCQRRNVRCGVRTFQTVYLLKLPTRTKPSRRRREVSA
eukprot:351893-Chlamydomonas_euryale.AAC.1